MIAACTVAVPEATTEARAWCSAGACVRNESQAQAPGFRAPIAQVIAVQLLDIGLKICLADGGGDRQGGTRSGCGRPDLRG